jgi:hypothetical protein
LNRFGFDPALKDRDESLHEGVMPFSHLIIQARLDVEARPSVLGKKQANERKIPAKPLALGPDGISQSFNLIVRPLKRSHECILMLVALVQNKGLVEILLQTFMNVTSRNRITSQTRASEEQSQEIFSWPAQLARGLACHPEEVTG